MPPTNPRMHHPSTPYPRYSINADPQLQLDNYVMQQQLQENAYSAQQPSFVLTITVIMDKA